jgi:hypothetical protein
MPEKTLHEEIDELIEASAFARFELRLAIASLAATIDEARDRFETIKREDESARINPEDLNHKESLP